MIINFISKVYYNELKTLIGKKHHQINLQRLHKL